MTDTKARILDAAERLFAETGFDAVPIREIMRLAEARLGLMNYYFETKEVLLESVIARRVDVLSVARREELAKISGTVGSTLPKLVDAYVDPYLSLMLNDDSGWRCYGRLIANLAQSSRWNCLIHRYFDATSICFIDELCQLYPMVARSTVIRAFVFSVGAMLNFFSMSGRMRSLSGGEIDDEALADSAKILKSFMVGGLERAFHHAVSTN